MIPRRAWLPGVLLLGAAMPAQNDGQTPAAQPTAKQDYETLTREYGAAQRALVDKYQQEVAKAKAAGETTMPAFDMGALAAEWVPRFQAGAAKYDRQDGAIRFLLWIAGNGKDADQDRAIATLIADHLTSPEFGEATAMIGRKSDRLGEARVRELLGEILAKNQDADVQAQALLARAKLVLERRPHTTGDGAEEPGGDDARKAAVAAAIADLERGIGKAQDGALKARLEGALFEQQHLQIGMSVPDIEGKDLDGVPFKLSDYKGKVVLLDFWGDW